MHDKLSSPLLLIFYVREETLEQREVNQWGREYNMEINNKVGEPAETNLCGVPQRRHISTCKERAGK